MIPDLTTTCLFLPELMLIVFATFIVVAGAFRPQPKWWPIFASLVYVATLAVTLAELRLAMIPGAAPLSGPLAIDYFGQLLRPFALLVGLLFTVMMARGSSDELVSERMSLVMITILGLMVIARANDLVFLFLGLELVSIPTYALLYLGRRASTTGEATAKYFFLSIFSSGLLLYGLSFLYGMAGTTLLHGTSGTPGIAEALVGLAKAGGSSAALLKLAPIALVLIFAGLGFKIAAVPFHFYAPDVYQGSTPANAGLLAVVPKIAGIAAMLRVIVPIFAGSAIGWQLALVLAIVTMTYGNICALWQKSIRRLLAYSSIAHSGYMLMGIAVALAADSPEIRAAGIGATVFYLAVYGAASIGCFSGLAYLGGGEESVDQVDQLAGLNRSKPWVAGSLAACLFSFAGIPIFAGFWGKFALLTSALEIASGGAGQGLSVWFTVLAVVGALNAAVAAAYYLRVVAAMYFQPEGAPLPVRGGAGALAAMAAATLLVVGIGMWPRSALLSARMAGQPAPQTAATTSTEVEQLSLNLRD